MDPVGIAIFAIFVLLLVAAIVLPKLSRARGVIHYTDTGFSLAGLQARVLGGDAQLDGGCSLRRASLLAT